MSEAHRRLDLPDRYDFAGTVGQLPMGGHDPCLRIAAGSFWWATRTPDGPATLRLTRDGTQLQATGYGPGRDWVLERADAVAGLRDDVSSFAEVAQRHPVVKELARRYAGFRLPATGRLFPRLLRAIFEQKVTGKEAYRAYAATVRHFHAAAGKQPAPGPLPLLLPPDPVLVAATPYWVFHPFGVEQRRADTLTRAAAVADALEACPDAVDRDRAADRGAGHRRLDRGRGGPGRVRRPGRGLGRRTTTSPTWSPGTWPARPGPGPARARPVGSARPTSACSSCWNRSAATGGGSACCWSGAVKGRPGSARGCRSAPSPRTEGRSARDHEAIVMIAAIVDR